MLQRGLPGWTGQSLKQGGRVVGHHTEAFVGIDTSKLRNAIAIADSGRGGEVRYLGEFPATEAAIRKLVAKLAAKCCQLTFCYEAGPTGYGLYRLLKSLGHDCLVVAPSLVPKKAGDRVKTNRRDAVSLAKLLRADELTAVWVPDERHEAMRDLSRARQAVKKDLQGKRQQISSLMLRLGTHLSGQDNVGTSPHEMGDGAEDRAPRAAHRIRRATRGNTPGRRTFGAFGKCYPRSGARVVALRGRRGPAAVRGIDLIAAVGVLAEIGDLSRFQNPRELMGYLGLVPSENSTGDKVKRGGITKAGNGRARRILVEAAWSYRYPPRVSRDKRPKVLGAPRCVREIAWKAQTRLCGRFRSLERKGKRRTVIATAIARELSAFIWAINRELMAYRQA